MTTVHFKYDIGQHVKIVAIGMVGMVDSFSQDSTGHQFRVVYWNDGTRNLVWMYDWELESLNDDKPKGAE